MEVTVPIGSEKKRPPRRALPLVEDSERATQHTLTPRALSIDARAGRGRNATKALDAESEELGKAEAEAALDKAKEEMQTEAPAPADKTGGDGGRDGKTRRRPYSGNRSRRNDKGLGLNGKPKPNSGPRGDSKVRRASSGGRRR